MGARPGVGEGDAEGRRIGGEAVGDRQRMEDAAGEERVDGHLGPLDKLLDERAAGARLGHGELDCRLELGRVAHERETLLALAVGRLDHAGNGQPRRLGRDPPLGLRDSRLAQPLALALLGDCERRGLGRERVRKAEARRHARGDGDGPVDSRRDDAVDAFRLGELPDRRLVLGGDDRALVRVLEAGRLRVAVAGHDEEPALARRAKKPELCRAGP